MQNITLGQVAGAITLITGISAFFIAIFKWYKKNISDKLDNFDTRITTLEQESSINKKENTILLKAQLACLKGLKEQGCNGPVSDSIVEIEAYLLEQAHR